MTEVTIGSVIWENAEKLGGSVGAAKIIDDGLAAWRAQRLVEFWDHFDGGIQRLTAEMIREWPQGAASEPMLRIVRLAQGILAETAGVLGLPDDFLPFDPARLAEQPKAET